MKTFNRIIKHLLLLFLIGITAISCKKETINFYVDITNLRNETVYFFVEDGSTESVPHGQVLTKDLSLDSENDYITVGVKLANGKILDEKKIKNGEIYKVVVNKKNSDANVSDEIDSWLLTIEITNNSSNSVYLYVGGEQKNIIASKEKLSISEEIINQSNPLIEVKNADGRILASKRVFKGQNYIKTINDPTFTITEIVLKNWRANNIFDTPDPWFQVAINKEVIGRTGYIPDTKDGGLCTFSNLAIKIDKIYDRIDFTLYDHDTNYSSSGSTYIAGVYITDFYKYWNTRVITISVSDLEFTIYGTWE